MPGRHSSKHRHGDDIEEEHYYSRKSRRSEKHRSNQRTHDDSNYKPGRMSERESSKCCVNNGYDSDDHRYRQERDDENLLEHRTRDYKSKPTRHSHYNEGLKRDSRRRTEISSDSGAKDQVREPARHQKGPVRNKDSLSAVVTGLLGSKPQSKPPRNQTTKSSRDSKRKTSHSTTTSQRHQCRPCKSSRNYAPESRLNERRYSSLAPELRNYDSRYDASRDIGSEEEFRCMGRRLNGFEEEDMTLSDYEEKFSRDYFKRTNTITPLMPASKGKYSLPPPIYNGGPVAGTRYGTNSTYGSTFRHATGISYRYKSGFPMDSSSVSRSNLDVKERTKDATYTGDEPARVMDSIDIYFLKQSYEAKEKECLAELELNKNATEKEIREAPKKWAIKLHKEKVRGEITEIVYGQKVAERNAARDHLVKLAELRKASDDMYESRGKTSYTY